MGKLPRHMLASAIITSFETYVDDATELSSAQELALLQKIYNKVWMDRPWEFTKAQGSGTLSTSVPYVTLPASFVSLIENNQTTDNTVSGDNNAVQKVIFVSSAYTPYQVINWSDRRQYLNQRGYAYLDMVNMRLYFTAQPTTADTYEFDYLANADTLTTSSTPAFPARFHDILYHGMAVDDDIILRFPKAQSYAAENGAKYDSYLADMRLWNANLQAN
jgi:hypothetical protein